MIRQAWHSFTCRFLGKRCDVHGGTSKAILMEMREAKGVLQGQTEAINRKRDNIIADALQGKLPPDWNHS